mmetsp:Transcript_44334/g.58811  ORF Transcript_44334/g.58811 Transcript_44334/m.58811 type:complete len:117 (+) Transcript_44334:81-431(+)
MNISLAKRYIKVIFWETLVIGILLATLLFTLRERLFGLFTQDKQLIELCLSVMPFFCWYGIIVDSCLQTFQGGVRALGIQNLASIVAICSYYLISLPLAYVFAFVLDLKLLGCWYG